ncbi:hypothetical protein [Streptomyces justiciae]|uniref:hypothetical protein n=1 Tax=Streptomyces justiciae TaxID=2780140 RepID=UPI001881749E|nr:hypothetical protein [Streptomyces justiciae]MBE8477493.1 hypothetical protein [Streptomyces justiciae]
MVSIEGPRSVREAAKLFIDQAVECRGRESWHSSVVAAFNKLDALMLTSDGDQLRAVLALGQEMDQIRRAARALPQDWRSQARGWAGNASPDLRAHWQEERDRLPEGAPTFEDVATLVSLLRDHGDPAAPLNAAVQAGYLRTPRRSARTR